VELVAGKDFAQYSGDYWGGFECVEKRTIRRNLTVNLSHDDIENLTLFGLGATAQHRSPSVVTVKTGSLLATANRAIVGNMVTPAELAALDKFYAGTPYVVWVSADDNDAKARVLQAGLSLVTSYPIMGIALDNLPNKPIDDRMTVRAVASDDELFTTWIPIVAQSYMAHLNEEGQKNYAEQFGVLIRYLLQSLPRQDVLFYLGLIDNRPVATSMFVRNSGFVGVHWIGVLPAFRSRGMGFAVTNRPLHAFKQQGAETALLFASPSGYPLYDNMGFERLMDYEVYTRKPSV
jgi:ribosomal protein S18 acetylase RimI-like enzyme